MKNIFKYLLISILAISLASCEEDLITYTGGGDAPAISFDSESYNVGVCEPTIPITVEVTKASNEDRTINFSIDSEFTTALDEEYSVNTSVTIPAGEFVGSTDITVDFAAIPDGASRELVLDLNIPENFTLNTRGTATVAFSSACTLNEVIFDFVFDDYPEEFVWQLYDAGGNFLAGDSAFGNYADLDSFTTTLCLEDGDYILRLLDGYGDGFCCAFGNGSADIILASCEGQTNLVDTITEEFGGQELLVPFTLGN